MRFLTPQYFNTGSILGEPLKMLIDCRIQRFQKCRVVAAVNPNVRLWLSRYDQPDSMLGHRSTRTKCNEPTWKLDDIRILVIGVALFVRNHLRLVDRWNFILSHLKNGRLS